MKSKLRIFPFDNWEKKKKNSYRCSEVTEKIVNFPEDGLYAYQFSDRYLNGFRHEKFKYSQIIVYLLLKKYIIIKILDSYVSWFYFVPVRMAIIPLGRIVEFPSERPREPRAMADRNPCDLRFPRYGTLLGLVFPRIGSLLTEEREREREGEVTGMMMNPRWILLAQRSKRFESLSDSLLK